MKCENIFIILRQTLNILKMKRLFTILFALAMTMTISAQESNNKIMLPSWINELKLSGYGIVQYQASTQKDAKSNTFQLRIGRLALDGRIANDFYWKAQIQFNGNTSTLGTSPRLVDLFAEWQRYDFFKVKAGQFKRPFTFENPMHPIDQGFMGYSQNVNALAGFSDRAGAHASNGRDIGLQIQGDLLKNAAGRNLLHYQVGVYNGDGINTKDKDNKKDIIGGLWVMPIKGLRIGAFGWTGTRGELEMTALDGTKTTLKSARKNRYALSAEYDKDDYTFRCEYIHSQGWGASEALGTKADGFYAFGIVPVLPKKLYAKARYNMYRPAKEWSSSKTMYEVGLNYMFSKKIQLNAEYARVNDRSLANHDYNFVDLQLAFKF